MLWALVDVTRNAEVETAGFEIKTIVIIGTGNPFYSDPGDIFIGTVVIDPFVWHVFERGK